MTVRRTVVLLICLASSALEVGGQTTRPSGHDAFKGYDFEHVVVELEASLSPLQQEMGGSLQEFVRSVERAETLLDQERADEAVELCAGAVEGVLAARDRVLGAMWEGQDYLAEQIGAVRTRLAQAVEASGGDTEGKLDARYEALLDGIAQRIAAEADPHRKQRLVAHYRTIRQLAQIRMMQRQLSPDQRKLWRSVLRVLDDAALAHQQLLMGTEVLFAQFESTAANLRDYRELIRTVDGAQKMLRTVQGLGQAGEGLAGLAQDMTALQQQLGQFNTQIEQTLQVRMLDLEAEVDAVQAVGQAEGSPLVATQVDAELAGRLDRLGQEGAKQP